MALGLLAPPIPFPHRPRPPSSPHTHTTRAVAFDVYELAFGKGVLAYSLRVFAMVMALLIFFALFLPTFLYFVVRAGGLLDFKGWAGLARHQWGSGGGGRSKGMMRRMGPLLREYYRTDFHPWQHDNSSHLKPLQPPSSKGTLRVNK